jgi:4-hydroxybenzoate polyprenyltransferase
LSGIFWTLFYDTIYAHQDSEDDALIGIKSTAVFFGANSIKWLITFIILAMSFYIIAVLDALFITNDSSKITICILGVIGFGTHLVWQVSKLDIKDWMSCLKIFRSNRNAGFIPVIFLIASLLL